MTDLSSFCQTGRGAARRVDVSGHATVIVKSLVALLLLSAIGSAQQTAQEDVPQPSTTLASQFFEHDFVNVFAFANGIYDTAIAQLTKTGSQYGGAFGIDVGGGISARHSFSDGTFSLSYSGDYRHYTANSYSNGTDQNLSILFSKRLTKHWSIEAQGGGGIVTYGGEFYSALPGAGASVLTNPLSSQSRLANAGINMTYQQTRRLSYTLGGQFFYTSFNYAGAFSSVGGTGSASMNYRTTSRTTVGVSYSRTYVSYSGSLGTSNIDGAFLTLTHLLPRHWTVSLSGGANHAHSQGIISTPVSLLLGQQLVTGYVVGPYNTSTVSPSFQATVTRNMRHSLISVSAGQGVNAGNGTYLTSKDQFLSGAFSLTNHLRNLSVGGGYTKLESIANTVSLNYSTGTISASYGWNLARYVSANLRYDFIHYDSLYQLSGLGESRFTFGLSFSSKSVPLTLF